MAAGSRGAVPHRTGRHQHCIQHAILLLQVHYQIVRPKGDHTGVRLKLTRVPQPMSAGMLTYAVGFVVPPKKKSHLVPNSCCYSGFQPLTGFAFRVHAHALGRYMTNSNWHKACFWQFLGHHR